MSLSGVGSVLQSVGNIAGAVSSFGGGRGSGTARFVIPAATPASAQSEIAEEQLRLAREQWELFQRDFLPLEREQAQEAKRDIGLFRPLKEEAVNQGLSSLRLSAPVEARFFREAERGATPRINEVRAEAAADVAQSFDQARARSLRDARRLGLSPARMVSLNRLTDIEEAAAQAAARTRAAVDERERARRESQELLQRAVSVRSGLPSVPTGALSPTSGRGLSATSVNSALGLFNAASRGFGQSVSTLSQQSRIPRDPGPLSRFTTDLNQAWTNIRPVLDDFGRFSP